MNIDPVFDTDIEPATDKQTFDSKVGLIGFFLCSFDTTHGLRILFSYPSKLKKNQNEINILKTHCVWKIENVPFRIDLKFSEFVYSAIQLQEDSQEGSLSTIDHPLYGIVIKKWKDSDPIPVKAFVDLKTTINSDIGSDLEILYQREKLALNPIKKREHDELLKKAVEIELSLKNIWKKFVYGINKNIEPFSTEIIPSRVNSSMIPVETSLCAQDLFKQKITMRVLPTEENKNRLMVVLINQSENLYDIRIHVSRRTEFFSETIWEHKLEEWPLKEDIILEFSKSDVIGKYLIKITSRNTTIDIKSLEIASTNAS
ncbi:MAG: hypothetical protein ACFFB2_16265 [Promethearchaeota archaeon]